MSGAGRGRAQRAVWRWALRTLRRDWRQQALIGGLLSFAVAVAAFGVSASFNVVPNRDGEFGTADHRIQLDARSPRPPSDTLDALRSWFGKIEVVAHGSARIPGSTDPLDVRAQDPRGPYGAPMLRLVSGRYPSAAGEVAMTARAADLLHAVIGETTSATGSSTRVVGLVENPADLHDDFVLAREIRDPDRYTVLLDAHPDRVAALPSDVAVGAAEHRPTCHALLICASSGQSEATTAAIGALALATLLLLLVALIASAGFVVVAQRRLRELGLFAAVGGSDRQMTRVVLANGLLVGLAASVAGTVIGVTAWIVAAPAFESAAGHRIDRLSVPWALTIASIVLGTGASVVASSKPARAIKRTPIVAALAARPPRPRPARRSAFVAVLLAAAGVVALSRAIDAQSDEANPALLIGGIAALVAGTVLVTPGVLGVLGRVAGRLPIGPRIAFRDLARYSGRSSTALAAIALAVALPTIVVVAARAAEAGEDEGNLSARQALIRIGDDRLYVPERSADQLRRLEDIVQTMSNQAEGQTVPLVVPVDHIESTTRGADVLHPAVVLGRRVKENTIRDVDQLYVATAVLADNLGLRSAQLEGAADVFTSQNGTLEYANAARGTDAPRVRRIITPGYASAPTSLITERALHANGWTAAPAGWLLESAEPINEEIVDSLREAAGAAGLTVEVRDEQGELGVIRSAAVAVGVLVALGVLALSLALLRVEAQGDLRTLAATGAPRSTRRAINASRGAGLAAAGAVVGVTMAYGGLVAGYGKDRSSLSHVPLVELGLLLVGLPLLAFAASWLLSGRPSHALRRASIE